MKTLLSHRLLRLYIIPLGLLSGIFALFYLVPNSIVRNDLLDHLGLTFPDTVLLLIFAACSWTALVLLANKRIKSIRLFGMKVNKVNEIMIIFVLLVLFTVFFSHLAIKRHHNLGSGLYDFGLEHQVVWNTSEGRWFETSVEVDNYLGDHFSLLIVIPAVIYKFFPSDVTILITQVLAVAISAAGIYLLAKKILHSRALGLAFMLIFAFYFGVSGLMLFEFHPVTFCLPFLTWGLYFYETSSRKRLAVILFILGALAKEEIGIFVGMYGFYRVFFKHDRSKTSIFLMIFGILFSLAALFVFIPYFREGVPADTLVRYKYWGDSGFSILINVLTRPFEVLIHLLGEARLSYIVRLLLSVGFLPLFAPKAALIVIPNLMINALTAYPPGQTSGYDHYDSITSLVMVWAAILGLKNIVQRTGTYKYTMSSLAFISLAVFLFHPLWRLSFMSNEAWEKDYSFVRYVNRALPENAIIGASNSVGAQLGEHRKLQSIDYDFDIYDEDPEYMFVDTKRDTKIWNSNKFKSLVQNGKYELMMERNGMRLYGLKTLGLKSLNPISSH